MAIPKRKTNQRIWRHSDTSSVRQSGRRAVRRLRHCWRRTCWKKSVKAAGSKNTLDPTLPEFVD